MSESSDKSGKPKPFQYSLWSLFVITTFLAIVLKIIAWQPVLAIPVLTFVHFAVTLGLWYVIWRRVHGTFLRWLLCAVAWAVAPLSLALCTFVLGRAFHFLP